MKFFKPEDFLCTTNIPLLPTEACNLANAKLEREGKIVYGHNGKSVADHFPDAFFWRPDDLVNGDVLYNGKIAHSTHKALLINIEPIEKCTHPSEKVKTQWRREFHCLRDEGIEVKEWQCECGAKVKPKSFEVFE